MLLFLSRVRLDGSQIIIVISVSDTKRVVVCVKHVLIFLLVVLVLWGTDEGV